MRLNPEHKLHFSRIHRDVSNASAHSVKMAVRPSVELQCAEMDGLGTFSIGRTPQVTLVFGSTRLQQIGSVADQLGNIFGSAGIRAAILSLARSPPSEKDFAHLRSLLK